MSPSDRDVRFWPRMYRTATDWRQRPENRIAAWFVLVASAIVLGLVVLNAVGWLLS